MHSVIADPNPPGPIEILKKTTSSFALCWGKAPLMDFAKNYSYTLIYNLSQPYVNVPAPETNYSLSKLLSGTSYNISVKTVGPLGFESESVHKYSTTSKNFILAIS